MQTCHTKESARHGQHAGVLNVYLSFVSENSVHCVSGHKNVASPLPTMSGASFQNPVNSSFPVIVARSEVCWRLDYVPQQDGEGGDV